MSRLSAFLALCVMMLAGSIAPYYSSAQDKATQAKLETSFEMSGTNQVKLPSAAGIGNQVLVIGNPGDSNSGRNVVVWQKQDSSTSAFPSGNDIGDARGETIYATASIAANRFNNTVHAAWIDQDTNRIQYRNRTMTSTSWGSTRTAVTTSKNPYWVNIGVASDNRVWIAWSQESRIRYVTSSDGGANWSSPALVSNLEPFLQPDVAGGPDGRGAIVFASSGSVYAGIWNGTGFDVELVGRARGDYYSPSATYDPSGRLHVAWRRVAGGGLFYSARQSNGSWPESQLAGGEVFPGVGIESDSGGNIHLVWTAKVSGVVQLFYKFRPSNGEFEDTINAGNPGAFIANANMGASLSNKSYGHGVVEYFGGRGLRTRYYLFSGPGTACGGTLNLSAEVTSSATINGTITPDSGCSPTQVKVSLNSPNDNVAPVAYNANVQLTVPADQLALCTQTVYARLYQNNTAGDWFSDSIKVDPGSAPNPVSALVSLENPMYDSVKDVAGNGPSDGDPAFTRVAQAKIRIQDAGDCSGLATFSAPGAPNQTITSSNHTQVIGLPAQTQGVSAPAPGPVPMTITVVDKVNNIQNFNTSIIYDPSDTDDNVAGDNGLGRPVLNGADTPTADDTAAARLTILRTLSFTDVDVSDNLYEAPTVPGLNAKGEFWGVWIATKYIGPTDSTPALTNPISDTTLNWFPVEVPQSGRTCDSGGCNFSVPVNLFQGLGFGPDLTKAGYYQVYAYFLDGAGNRSTGFRVATARLDQGYSLPGAFLTPVFFASN